MMLFVHGLAHAQHSDEGQVSFTYTNGSNMLDQTGES